MQRYIFFLISPNISVTIFVGLNNFNIKYPIEYIKRFKDMGANHCLHPNHESHIPNIQYT